MKRKISQAGYEELSDELKALYTKQGDSYVILFEDDEDDTGALKRAKDHEKARRKAAETEAKELRDKLKAFEEKEESDKEADLKKQGNFEELEASYKKKLADEKAARKADNDKYRSHIKRMLVDDVAYKIASEISTVPDLLAPKIAERLHVDFDGDIPNTRVLDIEGKISASTSEELKQEFLSNEKYSSILLASKASGGAGAEKTHSSGAQPQANNGQQSNRLLTAMSPEELLANIEKKVNLE